MGRITKEFLTAGVNGEVENINGLASNIIVGQAPPCGTGTVRVSIDENMYDNMIFENKPKKDDIKQSKKRHSNLDNIVDFNID